MERQGGAGPLDDAHARSGQPTGQPPREGRVQLDGGHPRHPGLEHLGGNARARSQLQQLGAQVYPSSP
jgi:hypothetical protein